MAIVTVGEDRASAGQVPADKDAAYELGRLRARCAELNAQHEELWRERMAIINGLGLERELDAGATFDAAVLAATGENADFAAGFRAARARAEELVFKDQTHDPMGIVIAIRGMSADGT